MSEIDPNAKPSGTGCVECLSTDGWWLHLRRCAKCGHIGCCDSSPNQHARKHSEHTKHTVIASFEPGENWLYDFASEDFVQGPELAAPHSHPANQPVPGPHGRVPDDWQELLN
jgi:ubiquitin-hydrolase Zn-finger-containing protein